MSISASLHDLEEVRAEGSDSASWIDLRDSEGNEVTVFIRSNEQLYKIEEAVKDMRKQWKDKANG